MCAILYQGIVKNKYATKLADRYKFFKFTNGTRTRS